MFVYLKTVKAIPTKRKFRTWMKEALQRAIVFWHKKFLRFHFTEYAYSRYGRIFKRRPERYRSGGFGGRLRKSARPLYETGLTRMMALGYIKTGGVGKMPANMVWAKGEIRVPPYLNYIRQWGYDPTAEIRALNEREITEMAHIVDQYLQSQLTGVQEGPGAGAFTLPIPTAYVGGMAA